MKWYHTYTNIVLITTFILVTEIYLYGYTHNWPEVYIRMNTMGEGTLELTLFLTAIPGVLMKLWRTMKHGF